MTLFRMKKNYVFAGLLAISFGFVAFQNDSQIKIEKFVASKHLLQNGGGQAALTGAPSEQNCTACHIGSTLNGATENVFQVVNSQFQPVTTYNPGDTYTVTLSMASSPAKKGFSATALGSSNTMAGSFTGSGIGGTQDFTGGSRKYVSHTASSNTSSNSLWAWTWTAPASNVGTVTFYVATNSANNDNTNGGDMIYLSQHQLSSFASVDEQEADKLNFTAGYAPESNTVVLNFSSLTSEDMFFNLVDMNGKSVYTKSLSESFIGTNKQTIALPSEVKNGMYSATLFVGNKPMSANIMVQK